MRLSLFAAVSTLVVSALSTPALTPAAAIHGIQEKRDLLNNEYKCGDITYTTKYIEKVRAKVCDIISYNRIKIHYGGFPKLFNGDTSNLNLRTNGHGTLYVFPLVDRYEKIYTNFWAGYHGRSYLLIEVKNRGCSVAAAFQQHKRPAQGVSGKGKCHPGNCFRTPVIQRVPCQHLTPASILTSPVHAAVEKITAKAHGIMGTN
ncbi:hypothetical protein K3495_g9971 [Podosphaera aphanis]|nr:hypothetical protein K3495_g9971 [Podosphaera aphanis]